MTAPAPEKMRDESAATCGACGTNVWIRDDHWWIDNRGRSGFRVLDAWHQHKPLYADLPADAPDDEL